jgi:hypothetical protein
MAASDEQLAHAVDDVLDPAWEGERRQAMRRWAWATAGRVAGGLVVLWVLGLVMHFIVGLTLPWVFFGFMGVLMAVFAFSESEGREHLRRE